MHPTEFVGQSASRLIVERHIAFRYLVANLKIFELVIPRSLAAGITHFSRWQLG
jgi:hypothetical protein